MGTAPPMPEPVVEGNSLVNGVRPSRGRS